MEAYLNKICKYAKSARAAVNNQKEKKYCYAFVKGEDGYCKYYLGIKPFIMSCASQCKK